MITITIGNIGNKVQSCLFSSILIYGFMILMYVVYTILLPGLFDVFL